MKIVAVEYRGATTVTKLGGSNTWPMQKFTLEEGFHDERAREYIGCLGKLPVGSRGKAPGRGIRSKPLGS